MLMSVFHNWLLEIACENYFVYIKRLSANDTGATGGHQVGLYIPSGIVEKLFPSINHTRELNPSVFLTAHVSSHDCPDSEARAIYYGTVAKLAMRQPFVLFKGLTFQKLCLPGAFRPGDHHNK
ncbi:EcoRII N-terminal effector-binding domain-containing protein, partial [Escherichia coli]|nr:EcoRII N-terminal effector-binding domain-containing protein [Escherichia coli]